MPSIIWTIAVSAITAVVTTSATGLIVSPRLEARKKRLGDVHGARDAFGAHMMRIICVCGQLQAFQPPADDDSGWTPIMRERLTGERERWWRQIHDATEWLIDNVATYAGSWPTRGLIGFAVSYADYARLVVLSEREEAAKLELLVALTVPVQRQFFGWPWSRALNAFADRRAFAETVSRINGERASE